MSWAFATQVTSALIHEIKNPLSTIQLNLQLMREDLEGLDSHEARRVIKRIGTLEREVERLTALLESYREFAHVGEMKRVPYRVNRLLDELVEFEQADLRQQKIEVLQYYDHDLPPAPVDSPRLKQALLNIIINAKQAMPGGGQLILRTLHDDQHVIVEITDTGEGIPAARLGRVFDAFYSTKKGGTGLGLPTARRIIDGHGGTITVQSEVGRGTLVRITLPRRAE